MVFSFPMSLPTLLSKKLHSAFEAGIPLDFKFNFELCLKSRALKIRALGVCPRCSAGDPGHNCITSLCSYSQQNPTEEPEAARNGCEEEPEEEALDLAERYFPTLVVGFGCTSNSKQS